MAAVNNYKINKHNKAIQTQMYFFKQTVQDH